jgi:pimeloyl-ACP methyl ester carboxylesterase
MPFDSVRITGEYGQPVLLLPGGAEACDGFFPGLPEELAISPGCRVIFYDRPGTGASAADGSLAQAASHLNSLIDHVGCGPVVLVGQSLGGAVAVLLARDHPENVAGLVLLDPTPINDPQLCARLESSMGTIAKLASVPVVPRLLSAIMRTAVKRQMRPLHLRPDCAAALDRTLGLSFTKLKRAVAGITELSAGFREADLPRLPAVVVTADRKADSPIRRAHARLGAAFGAPLVSWPGATHNVHLDHPTETLATVRDVVARSQAAR